MSGRCIGRVGAAAAVVLAGSVLAQESAAGQATAAAPGTAAPNAASPAAMEPTVQSGLQAAVTPYFWALSMSGDAAVRGVDTNVNVDFGDLLSHADKLYGFMGAVDLTSNRWVFQINGAYAHVGEEDAAGHAGAVSTSTDLDTNAAWLELAAGYRLIDSKGSGGSTGFTLDGLVGGRYTYIDVDADVTASANVTLPDGTVLTANVSKSLSTQQDWVEPFVGLRGVVELSDRWTLNLRGDVGGFGVDGSDFSWQAVAAMGYKFHMGNTAASFVFGYRALGQDYQNGGFEWEVVAHGPMIGMQMRF